MEGSTPDRVLRNQSRANVIPHIQRFFKHSTIPKSRDKLLQKYIENISEVYDWDAYYDRWARGDVDSDDQGADTEASRLAKSNKSTPQRKIFLTAGLYSGVSHNRKKNIKIPAFPLPLHTGLDYMNYERDFLLPWNIYCPSSGITKVPNWRVLKKSMKEKCSHWLLDSKLF